MDGQAPAARAFRGPAAFRAWLERHGSGTSGLLVRCYKTHASHKGLTYRQALDEALCCGWIDGVRRSLDDVSFSVRFTPRKAKSAWSTVNIKRFRELQAEDRVHASGLAAFDVRVKSRYSFEARPVTLDPADLKRFQANRAAWRYFEEQPPWYRRTSVFWVMSARREETRARRLALLIAKSEAREPIPPLKRPAP
jgi:uncharacterized protein YdeI (YjbR/CyaY-like superfamily)